MEIQEICRQLKPVIGNKAEQYWLAYLTEDKEGRKEIETAVRLLALRKLGLNIDNPQVFLSVPPEDKAFGEYPFGIIQYSGKDYYPFGLKEDEWIQHLAIFGRSGAGKTNTVFVLLDGLLSKGKPFLIFDWKRNYRDLLAIRDENILVYTVGRKTSSFEFNPLIPPKGTDPAIWLKKLIEIIAGAYYLGEGVMFLLQEALHAVYIEYQVYDGTPQKYPTFLDVLRWLEDNPVKGRKALWMDSTLRGIKSICFGPMGNVVNTTNQPNLSLLLEQNVILELDALTNNDKNMVIESMLLWIHHFRLAQPKRESFKHAIFIEEAHHILLRKPAGSGGEALTDTILREIRELGEGIILVDQHPSLISIPALGNTYTTIAMNLKHKSDVNAISAAMLLQEGEEELLGHLAIGCAVVKLQGRWTKPFQINIPHKEIPKGFIDDKKLQDIMNSRNVLKTDSINQEYELKLIHLNEREKALLHDIYQNQFSGVVSRYKRLMLSRREGDKLKKELIEKNLIEPVNIFTKSGRMVLLDITKVGWEYLEKMGMKKPKERFNESLEHKFWKEKIANVFQKEGYKVSIEEPVNGYTDIIIEKNNIKVAIEIETGKSDWKKNVEKNFKKKINAVVIIATNQDCLLRIKNQLLEYSTQQNILLKAAQEFCL